MNAKRVQFFLYTLLFSISVVEPSINSICMAVIIGLNFFFIITKTGVEFSVLTTMIMGNETFTLLNAIICIIGLIIIKRIKYKKIEKINQKIAFLFGLIVVNSVINGIVNNTIINVVFYLGYLFMLYISYSAFTGTLDPQKSIYSVKYLIIIEFIATLLRIGISNSLTPGDYFTGTLNNAHFFGNWIILTATVLIMVQRRKSDFSSLNRKETKGALYIYLLMLMLMLYLADAKQIILSLLLAGVLYIFVKKLPIKRQNILFWAFIGMYISFYLCLIILYLPQVRSVVEGAVPNYAIHLYDKDWNGRFAYSYGALFDSLANIRMFFGYGLGQYGSRVANVFAYTEMWRADNFINNFISSNFAPHYVPEFTKYVSYYNAQFVSTIKNYSAVLSYPFSSFIALLGETGIVGTTIVAYLINKLFKKTQSQFLIIYFLSICIFDIYFDNYQCIIALILYLIILNNKDVKQQLKGIKS